MSSATSEILLNPEQKQAVEHPDGPVLVFAGAGSGKTRVITARIAWQIQKGVRPSRILAVTFTNKASREMRERIQKIVGPVAEELWMGTFHSICTRLLRIEGTAIGIERNFVIYDTDDQLSLIKDIFKKRNIDEKSIQPRAILHEISSAKEKMLTPEKFSAQAAGYIERVAAEIYGSYNALLKKANALDFDDLIFMAVRLLEQRPEVREKYQERFLQILVDEYQDVNLSQYKLIQYLAGKHRNVMVVGDDDQSIYGWRGADVSLIHRFATDFEGAETIKLQQNYRCTKTILECANEVISRNRSRAQKRLWTENADGAPVSVTQVGTEHDEAMLVAETILAEVRTGRRKYGEYAVLYRTNAQSRVIEEAFLTLRIPHILVGGQRFYERKEIKDMVAYLRLTLNTADDVALRRIINTPPRGIGPGSVTQAEEWAAARQATVWEAVSNPEFFATLQKKAASSIQTFVRSILDAQQLAEQGPVTPVLKHLMNASGYIDALKAEHSQEALGRLDNLQEFLNVTAEYDASSEAPSLSGFLESVALVADIDALQEAGNSVTLMTLHSAKGLEFPVVFLLGLEEGVFPHSRSINTDSGLEEERRLCYVGMTRAQFELHMLYAHRRSLYGQPQFNRPSRFLEDIPQEATTSLVGAGPRYNQEYREIRQERSGEYTVIDRPRNAPTPPTDGRRQLRGPDWKPPFEVGSRVRHGKFGVGVVVACGPLKDDCEVTVAFPGVIGVKKLVQSLAKLEKA
ncbi:MAG: UvrD-helicase domain-containing protein [Fimbriimonadaceae bacterium]|nr:UvrD-helicase domain-containing protein [Fimbriimonadaceae bacterium]